MAIKLEVGKRYVSRDGEATVQITGTSYDDLRPFRGSDGCVYSADGHWSYSAKEHRYDLIALAPDEAPSTGVNDFRNPAYDGPMGVFEGYSEDDPTSQPDELATLRARVKELEEKLAHEASVNRGDWACQRDVDRYQIEADALRAENARLREALGIIKVFGNDTLSGRDALDSAAYKDWLIDSVRVMRDQASTALARTEAENG